MFDEFLLLGQCGAEIIFSASGQEIAI